MLKKNTDSRALKFLPTTVWSFKAAVLSLNFRLAEAWAEMYKTILLFLFPEIWTSSIKEFALKNIAFIIWKTETILVNSDEHEH